MSKKACLKTHSEGGLLVSKIGYVRVSTREQNTARQDALMERLGVEKIFVDKLSGKNAERPQLIEMLGYVREGDVLVVESFSRLSRSLKDFFWILESLEKKKVTLQSQKETVDTSTVMGRFMVTVLAALSEMEREQMLERQAEGIAAARASGKQLGRPRAEFNIEVFCADLEIRRRGEMNVVQICRKHGMSRSTFYKIEKEVSR